MGSIVSFDFPTVAQLQQRAVNHPILARLNSEEALARFMEFQVWCVWDFMVLTKAIQRGLDTGGQIWAPPANPEALRLINLILLSEETDIDEQGKTRSHLEIFVDAMKCAGADSRPIQRFIERLPYESDVLRLLSDVGAPRSATMFVKRTLADAAAPLATRVASFHFGRENLIPQMFIELARSPVWNSPKLAGMRWYIERHISLDTAEHSPLSLQLLKLVLGKDKHLWQEAEAAGVGAVRARIEYLDAILEELETGHA